MRVYPELTVDGEFKALGDLGHTGALNDRQFTFLRSRGFTNSLTDMFGQYRSWTPAQLFTTEGSRGFFYDFSDYTTQFTDTAGTTAITGVGQSLGLVLDKSAGLALGPELVTNGTFDVNTAGWSSPRTNSTLSVVSGRLRSTAIAAGAFGAVATLSGLRVGASYRTSFSILTSTASGGTLGVYRVTTTLALATGGPVDIVSASTPVTSSPTFVATATTMYIGVISVAGAGGEYVEIDNISVRELAGNHATQATAGSRPLTTTIGTGYRGVQFDGVDDFLQTAAIDFSNSDKMTVVAGVRKLSDAARGLVVELGIGGVSSAFLIDAPGPNPATQRYRFGSVGATVSVAETALGPSPDTAVITGLGDIPGDSAILRRNGVQVGQSTADQGAGNFANAIVYIGRRGGTTLPYNGIITFLCVINRTLTAAELAQLETFANSRTGAY